MKKSVAEKTPGRRILKIAVRILLIVLLLLFVSSAIALIYFRTHKESIYQDLLSEANSRFSGEVEIETIDFSPFKSFPQWSLHLKQVNIFETKKEDLEEPIISLSSIYLVIDAIELIKGNIDINKIMIIDGFANVIADEEGKLNVTTALSPPQKEAFNQTSRNYIQLASIREEEIQNEEESSIIINLDEFTTRNIKISFDNQNAKQIIKATINESVIGFRYQAPITEASVKSDILISSARFNGLTYLADKSIKTDLPVVFDALTNVFNTENGSITFEDVDINVQGSYSLSEKGEIDVILNANDQKFTILSYLLEDDILNSNLDFLKNGNLFIDGSIKGETVNSFPSMELEVSSENLELKIPFTDEDLVLELEAYLNFGNKPDLSNALLRVDTLYGKLPGGLLNGSFYLEDFVDPYIRVLAEAHLDLEGYDKIFKIQEIDSLEGKVDFSTLIQGTVYESENSLAKEYGYINLSFNEVEFTSRDLDNRRIGINGNIDNDDKDMIFSNARFQIDSSDLVVNGKLNNIFESIIDSTQFTQARLNLTSDYIRLSDFGITLDSTSYSGINMIQNLSTDLFSDFRLDHFFIPKGVIGLKELSTAVPGIFQIADSELMFDATGVANRSYEFSFNHLKLKVSDGTVAIKDSQLEISDKSIKFKGQVMGGDLSIAEFNKAYTKATDDTTTLINLEPGVIESIQFNSNVQYGIDNNTFLNLDLENLNLRFVEDSSFIDIRGFTFNPEREIVLNDSPAYIIPGLESLQGQLSIETLNSNKFSDLNIASNIYIHEDSLNLKTRLSDRLVSDDFIQFSAKIEDGIPYYNLNYANDSIFIKNVLERFYDQELLLGTISLDFDLKTNGLNNVDLTANSSGSINVRGDEIILRGIDIDDLLQKFEKTQNFNFADVGAVFLVGPFGALITKGGDFRSLIRYKVDDTDSTHIQQFISEWEINNGEISTKDVGFTTDLNRIVLDGTVNLNRDSIEFLNVSVINDDGCSLLDQSIYGKYDDIQYGETKVAGKVFGAVINVLKIVTGNNCQSVYDGELKHPESE